MADPRITAWADGWHRRAGREIERRRQFGPCDRYVSSGGGYRPPRHPESAGRKWIL